MAGLVVEDGDCTFVNWRLNWDDLHIKIIDKRNLLLSRVSCLLIRVFIEVYCSRRVSSQSHNLYQENEPEIEP